MNYVIWGIVVMLTLFVIILIVGKINNRKNRKNKKINSNNDRDIDVKEATSTGWDMRQMMKDKLLDMAVENCNITKEEAEREIGGEIDEWLYSKKEDSSDELNKFYWENFNSIVSIYERIKGCDNTWYWLSNIEEYIHFDNSYKALCELSHSDNYHGKVNEHIEMYEIDPKSKLASFLLSPVDNSHLIKDFVNIQYNAGEEFWELELSHSTEYEKKKVAEFFPNMELHFPYLGTKIVDFRKKHNI